LQLGLTCFFVSRCLDSIGGWHGSVGFLLFVFLADGFWLRLWALGFGLWEVIRAVYFLRRWMGGVDQGEGSFVKDVSSLVCVDTNVYMKIMQSRNGEGVANSDD
jgi:hypothetical protein